VAAGTAAAVNAAVYLAARAAGIFPPAPLFPVRQDDPMTLGPILLVSVVAGLAGVGVYALLRPRVRAPVRFFAWIAMAVLVVSLLAPLAITGWTAAQAWTLNLMHVAAAAAVLWQVRAAERR
jgi:predicted membrane channel-forming protein YqfA (hemolysin III family)